MIGNRPGDASGQAFIFKIATVFVIVFIFGAIFVIQRALRQTGGTAETYIHPVQKEDPVAGRLPYTAEPESETESNTELTPPPILPVGQPKPEAPVTQIVNQPIPPRMPERPAPSTMPVRPSDPDRGAGVRTLPVPLTEVHPLSDAEEVMGAASSEVGEVGVTRTFTLPDQGEQDEILPPPND